MTPIFQRTQVSPNNLSPFGLDLAKFINFQTVETFLFYFLVYFNPSSLPGHDTMFQVWSEEDDAGQPSADNDDMAGDSCGTQV